MSDPALIGIAIVFIIACIPAGLLALPVIATIIRVKNLESQTKTALAQIAEFQGNVLDALPEDLKPRLAHVERELKIASATRNHLRAQTMHSRGNEGGVQ